MAFCWRGNGDPILNACLECDFSVDRTSFDTKPNIFVIFQGGLDPVPPPPSGSAFGLHRCSLVVSMQQSKFILRRGPFGSQQLTFRNPKNAENLTSSPRESTIEHLNITQTAWVDEFMVYVMHLAGS